MPGNEKVIDRGDPFARDASAARLGVFLVDFKSALTWFPVCPAWAAARLKTKARPAHGPHDAAPLLACRRAARPNRLWKCHKRDWPVLGGAPWVKVPWEEAEIRLASRLAGSKT